MKLPDFIIITITSIFFLGFIAMMIAPKGDTAASGYWSISYVEDTDGRVNESHLALVKITSNQPLDSIRVKLHYYRDNVFHTLELSRLNQTGYFGVEIPSAGLGERTYYYLEAESYPGDRVVLPPSATSNFTSEYDYYKVRWEGKASFILLLLHIFLMIAAMFLLIHALYYAICYLQTQEKEQLLVKCVNWGVLVFFITGFPIGWIIEKQVLGNYWEGIPFGWDITDSKTLFIMLYWLIPIILRKWEKISIKGFARWTVFGVIFTVAMFLLPHSL